ncbi:MAG: hypothetical protein JWQ09_5051 [Segetibacter sp.]|nr:hypothetical protein [Segetibacter sp.]
MIKKFFRSVILGLFIFLVLSNTEGLAQAPEFRIGSLNNVSATTVVIPVTTKNFTGLMGLQGSINWDNSKITYASVSTPVSQLSGMQFNPSTASSTGRLSFIWVDNDLIARTIADSTVLFSITFNVVPGATGVSDISFSNNPTQLLVSDVNGSAVNNAVYNNGFVDFPGLAMAPEFKVGSVTNVSTTQIVIPVTTKNFGQLLGLQGSLAWDTNKLTYASVSSPISQLTGMQFNQSLNGISGALSFIWVDENLVPQTIADNAVLFSITFNVVTGAAGKTDINFTNTPTGLLVSDARNTPVDSIVYTKGNISFPGAQLPPQFIIRSVNNVTTNTVTIPVLTKSFTDLTGWQGSINWDNSKLTLASVSSPHTKLSGMLFNSSVNGTTGRLSFIWADNNSMPQTITDSTVLFTITFNVLSNSGITDINFCGTPTPLFVSDASSDAVDPVTYTKGTVTFSAELCSGGTTITSNITGISYQWQVNTGSGFANLTDNANYTGTNTITLGLNNIPSAWSGYLYRCLINGNYSSVYSLRFRDYLSANSTINWEDLAKWSCIEKLPDANTDVIITSGTVILNSSTSVKSITLGPGANLIIQPGQTLTITGK